MDEPSLESGYSRVARKGGPGALFGRGRVALTAVMLAIAAIAYLSRERPVGDLMPKQRALVRTPAAPISTRIGLVETVLPVEDQSAIIQNHFGMVLDQRAALVQRVGQRLVNALERQHQGDFRFRVLADNQRLRTYAFADGTIMTTLGLVQLATVESEVAAILSDAIEQIVRSRDPAWSRFTVGALSGEWMRRAGYDPRGIDVVRQRLAARTRSTLE